MPYVMMEELFLILRSGARPRQGPRLTALSDVVTTQTISRNHLSQELSGL